MAQGQCKKSVFPAEFFIAINLINKQIVMRELSTIFGITSTCYLHFVTRQWVKDVPCLCEFEAMCGNILSLLVAFRFPLRNEISGKMSLSLSFSLVCEDVDNI